MDVCLAVAQEIRKDLGTGAGSSWWLPPIFCLLCTHSASGDYSCVFWQLHRHHSSRPLIIPPLPRGHQYVFQSYSTFITDYIYARQRKTWTTLLMFPELCQALDSESKVLGF